MGRVARHPSLGKPATVLDAVPEIEVDQTLVRQAGFLGQLPEVRDGGAVEPGKAAGRLAGRTRVWRQAGFEFGVAGDGEVQEAADELGGLVFCLEPADFGFN